MSPKPEKNPYQSPNFTDKDDLAPIDREDVTVGEVILLLLAIVFIPFVAGIAGASFWLELVLGL